MGTLISPSRDIRQESKPIVKDGKQFKEIVVAPHFDTIGPIHYRDASIMKILCFKGLPPSLDQWQEWMTNLLGGNANLSQNFSSIGNIF